MDKMFLKEFRGETIGSVSTQSSSEEMFRTGASSYIKATK
jgi:hypothetical protein